jgi:Integrin beta cytoplasmic domain
VDNLKKTSSERKGIFTSMHEKEMFSFNGIFSGYRHINVLMKTGCTAPVNVLAIVLGVIGGILLIGLILLLIWKLLVTIHDRREFARFEKEREKARWDMVCKTLYLSVRFHVEFIRKRNDKFKILCLLFEIFTATVS